jgi:hypothetical protein
MAPPPTPSTPTPISKAIDALTNRVRTLIAHLHARGPHYRRPGQPRPGQPPRQALGSGRQRIQQDGQWRDGDTSILRVNVWRPGEHLADSLTKGDRVMVTAVSASAAGSDGDKRGDGHQLDRRMRAIPS